MDGSPLLHIFPLWNYSTDFH